jgi:hypothetical protein
VNARTRRVALYAIAAIAILASGNALAHSYAGLYGWAVHHRLTGWQALSWPAEIDVFLAVGELALYVAYLDGWPVRQRVWPWATALTGLAVSVAGNVGHIQPLPGYPVAVADRLTAAASPLAAFAGLTVGLLVLRMNRQRTPGALSAATGPFLHLAPARAAGVDGHHAVAAGPAAAPVSAAVQDQPAASAAGRDGDGDTPAESGPDPRLLEQAGVIYRSAAQRGERLSQRALARRLRRDGHRFPNQQLHPIAVAIGLKPAIRRTRSYGR